MFKMERRLWAGERMDRDAPLTSAELNHLLRFQFREPSGAFQAGVLADLAALILATLIILIAARAFRSRAATP